MQQGREKQPGLLAKAGRPALLAAMATGLLLAAGCQRGGQPAQAAPAGKDGKPAAPAAEPASVEVAKVVTHPIAASFNGTASLEARSDVQVVAKTSGIATQVLVEEGQAVHAGQMLVQLDSGQQQLRVQQMAAQVDKLSKNLARSESLLKDKLIAANDVDQLRFDLRNAQAQLNLARLDLSYTRVTAPISGVVAQRMIKPGNLVQISTPIFRIIENGLLEAPLNVPERNLAVIHPGLPVTLTVDAIPQRSFEGRVARISPVVDSGSGTFRAVCAFNGGGVLQPGMFGRIAVVFDRRADALAIPRQALLEDDAQPAVFVVRAGKAQRVAVKTGHSEGAFIEVVSGLALGDEVVTAGKAALRDGLPVKVIRTEPDAPAPASAPKAG